MSDSKNGLPEAQPVYVFESIPYAWEHQISQEVMDAEGIPTPEHLCILPEMARGGMGHIHGALDRNLLRQVALKLLDKSLAQNPMYREGFIAEAQMTGQPNDQRPLPVTPLGQAGGRTLLGAGSASNVIAILSVESTDFAFIAPCPLFEENDFVIVKGEDQAGFFTRRQWAKCLRGKSCQLFKPPSHKCSRPTQRGAQMISHLL